MRFSGGVQFGYSAEAHDSCVYLYCTISFADITRRTRSLRGLACDEQLFLPVCCGFHSSSFSWLPRPCCCFCKQKSLEAAGSYWFGLNKMVEVSVRKWFYIKINVNQRRLHRSGSLPWKTMLTVHTKSVQEQWHEVLMLFMISVFWRGCNFLHLVFFLEE